MDAKEESAKTFYYASVQIAEKEVDEAQKEVDEARTQWKAAGTQWKTAGDLVGHYTAQVMSLNPVHHPQVIVGW